MESVSRDAGLTPKSTTPKWAMIGVRMTYQRETEVKVEAASRGISVATLFDEMWDLYVRERGA